MKILQPESVPYQGKIKSNRQVRLAAWFRDKPVSLLRRIKSIRISGRVELIGQRSQDFLEEIKSIGFTKSMDDYERRKLSIFNQLNFFQLVTGTILSVDRRQWL